MNKTYTNQGKQNRKKKEKNRKWKHSILTMERSHEKTFCLFFLVVATEDNMLDSREHWHLGLAGGQLVDQTLVVDGVSVRLGEFFRDRELGLVSVAHKGLEGLGLELEVMRIKAGLRSRKEGFVA